MNEEIRLTGRAERALAEPAALNVEDIDLADDRDEVTIDDASDVPKEAVVAAMVVGTVRGE